MSERPTARFDKEHGSTKVRVLKVDDDGIGIYWAYMNEKIGDGCVYPHWSPRNHFWDVPEFLSHEKRMTSDVRK